MLDAIVVVVLVLAVLSVRPAPAVDSEPGERGIEARVARFEPANPAAGPALDADRPPALGLAPAAGILEDCVSIRDLEAPRAPSNPRTSV
jgi:hypothetical protein